MKALRELPSIFEERLLLPTIRCVLFLSLSLSRARARGQNKPKSHPKNKRANSLYESSQTNAKGDDFNFFNTPLSMREPPPSNMDNTTANATISSPNYGIFEPSPTNQFLSVNPFGNTPSKAHTQAQSQMGGDETIPIPMPMSIPVAMPMAIPMPMPLTPAIFQENELPETTNEKSAFENSIQAIQNWNDTFQKAINDENYMKSLPPYIQSYFKQWVDKQSAGEN